MFSKYLRLVETALEDSDFEPRTCLISVLILTISAYSFRIDIAFTIILLTFAFNPKKTTAGLLASTPFMLFFAFASFILGGFEKIPTVIALICIGCLLYGIQPEKFSYALMFFRVPPKLAHSIAIAMRMFQILIRDFELTSEALRLSGAGGFSYYFKLPKAFSAIAVLRAFTMAEVLYSRGFDFDRRIVKCENPKLRDWLLLALSISIACYTYLTRNAL